MLRKMCLAMLAGASVCAWSAADAATTTGKLDVQLDVVPGCAFSQGASGTPTTGGVSDAVLSFGRVTGETTGQIDAQAVSTGSGSAVTVVCSSTFVGANAPQLTLDVGLNAGTGTQRQLVGPSGKLVAYDLYQDQGRAVPFDPATPTQLVIPTAGVVTPVNIYGRIADVSGLDDGRYTDTVTMTLTY